jgi:hypothetical protein
MDTRFYKIGDGITSWKDLLYMASGPSAYDVAVANGFEGSELEWLASLKGDNAPIKGVDYWTFEDKEELVQLLLLQLDGDEVAY